MGPRTVETVGTPQATVCVSDFAPPKETYSVLSDRYDWNQLRAESESLMVWWRR